LPEDESANAQIIGMLRCHVAPKLKADNRVVAAAKLWRSQKAKTGTFMGPVLPVGLH
jgi:hypothetical protein